MNIARSLRYAVAVLLLVAPPAAWTFDPVNDDTDIFLHNPAHTAVPPNVLIFVDNTANWSSSAEAATKYFHVRAALLSVIAGMDSSVNVGLGLFTETGGANTGDAGAYIRYAVRNMNSTNRARLIDLVTNLNENGDKGNAARFSLAMMEMLRYYGGVRAYAGHDKVKRDFPGNTANNPYAANLGNHAFASAGSDVYRSPIEHACQKNFIIFIANGPPNDNSASLKTAEDELATLTQTSPPTTITITPNGQQGNWADEYARFMAESDCNKQWDGDQHVFTYVIEVVPGTTGQGPSATALLKSMADNGGGKYFGISGTNVQSQIVDAIKSVLNEIEAVNSVFAATTLPVSVNVRGTNLNQVYIGVFRPDAQRSPRWLGNLKMYRLGVNSATNNLYLEDAKGDPAQNSATGFISANATSFWTEASTYWGFRAPSLNGVGGASDAPDGDLVEKGGVAQWLRQAFATSQATRKLYTCVDAGLDGLCANNALLSATPFDSSHVTAAALGAYTTYNVASLASNGTTVTLVLAGAPNPTWAVGNEIIVQGATPNAYNGKYQLTAANNGTFTYQYELPSIPPSSAGLASSANHGLQTGDRVTIGNAGTFNVTDATVTKIDDNTFRYAVAGASGTVNSGIVANGHKAVTSLTGVGTTATAVVPSHGYSTGNTVTISGATADYSAFNHTAMITVLDADSFTYSTSTVITGPSVKAQVTTAGTHFIVSNQPNVYVIGNTVGTYNGGAKTGVKRIGDTQLAFDSTEPLTGTAGYIGVRVLNFQHPTSGGPGGVNTCSTLDHLTVTTDGPHGLAVGASFELRGGTGGAGSWEEYNGTWTIASATDLLSDVSFRLIQNSTTNTWNALGRGCSFDQGPNGMPPMTMVVGKAIVTAHPIVSATGDLRSTKAINVSSIAAVSSAIGAIKAGRPLDSNNDLRNAIVAWVRGADNYENENPQTGSGAIRPSVHGDVLHSRPAVINYNRYGDDNDIYTLYGSNDGVFRAVRGGLASHADGPDAGIKPGTERWGFIPREFFGRLKRLRDNVPTISSSSPRDYFADGPISVYQKDVNNDGKLVAADGDKVHVYVTMRRGGELIYALDVSDPSAPRLLWRKARGDAGWEMVGQTWSEPKVAKLRADIGNAANPENVVLIFGAGYEPAVEDLNPCLLQSWSTTSVVRKAIGSGTVEYTEDGSCTVVGATGDPVTVNRTKGHAILVVDAFNGNVVWQASAGVATSSADGAKKLHVPAMTCAIPSDVTVLDKNRDGYADRIYVGDTCGQVWRADVAVEDMDEWIVTRIADLSSGGPTDIANKRKFMYAPDLVFATDTAGNYTAVLLGSGDREHAFDTMVQNAYYMIKDRDSADPGFPQSGAPNGTSVKISGFETSPIGQPVTHSNPDTTGVFDATSTYGVNERGWRMGLRKGEKVISGSTTIAGTTYFNTNQPKLTGDAEDVDESDESNQCASSLGIAREYLVSFVDAAATTDVNGVGGITISDRSSIHPGGGYLPTPVPVVVEIDGKKHQAVISGTSVQTPPGLSLERRTRSYWYKDID
jgi:type IV pilus assembly protein PilY1